MLNNKILNRIVKWVVLVIAYSYLLYKLFSFSSYEAFVDCFRMAGGWQWSALIGCVCLLPFNLLMESVKWRYLLRSIVPFSLWQSCKSVLVGHVGAFPTPNRLGEYPARVTMMPEGVRASAIAMGFVGSLVQTCVIVVCGVMGALLFLKITALEYESFRTYLIIVLAVLLFLIIFIFLLPYFLRYLSSRLKNKLWFQQFYNVIIHSNLKQLIILTLVSFTRYLIFSFQFYLMLHFCDVFLTPLEALSGISLMYLFVTITPSIGLSDVVIRSSYSIFIFSFFSVNVAGIAVASMLLWIVNSSILMLIGSLLWNSRNVKI